MLTTWQANIQLQPPLVPVPFGIHAGWPVGPFGAQWRAPPLAQALLALLLLQSRPAPPAETAYAPVPVRHSLQPHAVELTLMLAMLSYPKLCYAKLCYATY